MGKETDMSRSHAKRILGLTNPQWMVLGILLLFLCVTVIGGFWWLNSMVAKAYIVPEMNLPEVTLPPALTALPTVTLLSTPSPTPITYESLIPAGWKRFRPASAHNIEIWVPESYIGQTDGVPKKAVNIFNMDEDEALDMLLRLRDTAPGKYSLITTFELAKRPVVGSDLDAMIDTQFGTLMRSGRLLERGKFVFKIGNVPARRLIFDININGLDAGFAIYVVQDGIDLYLLGFATAFNDLYTRLPAFDESIQTFRIVPIVPTPTLTFTVPAPTNTSLP